MWMKTNYDLPARMANLAIPQVLIRQALPGDKLYKLTQCPEALEIILRVFLTYLESGKYQQAVIGRFFMPFHTSAWLITILHPSLAPIERYAEELPLIGYGMAEEALSKETIETITEEIRHACAMMVETGVLVL